MMATKAKVDIHHHDNHHDKILFDEKFVIRNLDTGEVINITEVPKTGVVGRPDKKKEEPHTPGKNSTPTKTTATATSTTTYTPAHTTSSPSKLANSTKEPENTLKVREGESQVVSIEIYMEGMEKNKGIVPIRVKMEDQHKFASMYTVKLHKLTIYKLRIVITPSPVFQIAGIEDWKMENHRVKIKPESGKMVGASYQAEAEWNLPSSSLPTPDAVRHSLPIHLSFKVVRASNKEESSTVTFTESFQAKIYNGDVSNVQTGNVLNSFSTACNIKTHDSISGISYNLSS